MIEGNYHVVLDLGSCRKQKWKQALGIIVACRKEQPTLLLNPMFLLHFTMTTNVFVAVP